MSEFINRFLIDRKEALTKAVMEDNWDYVRVYCDRYGVPIPKDERIMKAGIYKAVQECTDIPKDVKDVAFMKCLELGFSPLIRPFGEEDDDDICGQDQEHDG